MGRIFPGDFLFMEVFAASGALGEYGFLLNEFPCCHPTRVWDLLAGVFTVGSY